MSTTTAVSIPHQVPAVRTVVDGSHASEGALRFFGDYFTAKSAPDVTAMMNHFAADGPFRYMDAVIGTSLDYRGLHEIFATFMPQWGPDLNSYPVRVVGDEHGAVVFFNNVAGLFGAEEIRITGVIDIRDGRVVRQVDYWDGRHFGVAATRALQAGLGVSADTFPTDGPAAAYPEALLEDVAGEHADPTLRGAVHDLSAALADGDVTAAVALFAADALFEDATAHLQLRGARAIGRYLAAVGHDLPYAHPSTTVRHVVGSAIGGGYEWSTAGAVPRGLTVLELDADGRITRLTGLWNGGFVSDAQLTGLAVAAIEH